MQSQIKSVQIQPWLVCITHSKQGDAYTLRTLHVTYGTENWSSNWTLLWGLQFHGTRRPLDYDLYLQVMIALGSAVHGPPLSSSSGAGPLCLDEAGVAQKGVSPMGKGIGVDAL